MPIVTAVNYTLNLIPDLEQFTFTGRAEITLKAAEPVAVITLDALDMTIHNCRLRAAVSAD